MTLLYVTNPLQSHPLWEQVFSVLKFCVFIKGKKNRYKIVAEPCLILIF